MGNFAAFAPQVAHVTPAGVVLLARTFTFNILLTEFGARRLLRRRAAIGTVSQIGRIVTVLVIAPRDVYCRVPQDSPFNVRGARNLPCETVPGKRAPTVKLCESDEHYVPLNDGFNWKGDPNATLSGQDLPQVPPGSSPAQVAPAPGPATPPIAVAEYDPATGTYVGPDGHEYTQANLARNAKEEQTWETMLLPPPGG